MKVAIAGGHGKIARLLEESLASRGDGVIGLIRNPDHADDLRQLGAEPVVCDLEKAGADEVAEAVGGCDAVIFAAGAGPGSGAERKRTMDLGGAVKLIEAAKANGISRYLIVSSMGAAEPPAEGGGTFGEYLRAKAGADQALRESGLDYTIVRPGHLTDDPPSGKVKIAERLESGEISRADVAAVLLACLDRAETIRHEFDLIGGETPIEEALAGL
jgi:nucleoside-diphosphate-sugar epimerase